ncbi:MAG: hypothetical protein QOJ48_2299 [Frankiales bacterium]|jgi:4-amino-4-deoxy-L-arabinose transferase-like glycosyltransferase|nr:hypothetical protein [Frankiales bacterium]
MRRVPGIVWLLLGLHGALLCAYALLFPPYTGFDEPAHVDMVVHVAEGDTWPWPGPGELPLSTGVARSSNPVYFGPLKSRPYTNDPYPDRGDRKSLAQLGGMAPATSNFPNQMVQHPPAYYALGALVLKAVPGNPLDLPYDRVVQVLRLLSIALMLPLPVLAWAAAERLFGRTAGITAAALSLGVPGVARVGSAVDNDSLLILAVAGMTVALTRVMTGDLSRRTSLAAGALFGLALLTKGFALALPPFVVAAYLTQRRGWRLPWRRLALALGTAALLGGPWYLMNLVRFGTLQPDGLGKAASALFRGPATPGVTRPLGIFVRAFNMNINRRFWGAIGMTDAPSLATSACYALSVVVLALALVALLRRRECRPQLAVLLLATPLLLVIVVYGSLKAYRYNGHLPGVQGRYLYPSLVAVAVVVAVGIVSLLGRYARLAPLLGLVTALLLQAWALSIVLRAYWVPGRDVAAGWRGILHWSAWPTPVTVVMLAALPVATVACLAAASRYASRADAPALQPAP